MFTIENLLRSAYLYHKSEYNKNFEHNTMKLNINNKEITNKIQVNYIRKNINYSKDIYILMSTKMEDNIKLNCNTQYFSDITYYAIPRNKSKLKIFILLAFNKDLYKTILCNISLIYNENKETFINIFNFLKNKYNFYPTRITFDYSIT